MLSIEKVAEWVLLRREMTEKRFKHLRWRKNNL